MLFASETENELVRLEDRGGICCKYPRRGGEEEGGGGSVVREAVLGNGRRGTGEGRNGVNELTEQGVLRQQSISAIGAQYGVKGGG